MAETTTDETGKDLKAEALRKAEEKANALLPAIQAEMERGEVAYRKAGEMLVRARELLPPRQFKPWLTKNFLKSRTVAYRCIKLANAPVPSDGTDNVVTDIHDNAGRKTRHANGDGGMPTADDSLVILYRTRAARMLREGYAA